MTTHLTDTQKTQIRIALAKWQFPELDTATLYIGAQGDLCGGATDSEDMVVFLPNYPADLNACHTIEVKLTDEEHYRFMLCLKRVISDRFGLFRQKHLISAKAEHRALALFRSLNLGELRD